MLGLGASHQVVSTSSLPNASILSVVDFFFPFKRKMPASHAQPALSWKQNVRTKRGNFFTVSRPFSTPTVSSQLNCVPEQHRVLQQILFEMNKLIPEETDKTQVEKVLTPEGLPRQVEKALEYTRKWRVTTNVQKLRGTFVLRRWGEPDRVRMKVRRRGIADHGLFQNL